MAKDVLVPKFKVDDRIVGYGIETGKEYVGTIYNLEALYYNDKKGIGITEEELGEKVIVCRDTAKFTEESKNIVGNNPFNQTYSIKGTIKKCGEDAEEQERRNKYCETRFVCSNNLVETCGQLEKIKSDENGDIQPKTMIQDPPEEIYEVQSCECGSLTGCMCRRKK